MITRKIKIGAIISLIILIVMSLLYLSITGYSIKEEKIKIGGVFHLTGAGAFWGMGEMNGVLMAIDEVNLKGGINEKQIELITENGETDFPKTINAIQKLINVDEVDFIVGPTWFGQVASPLAKQFKVLMVSPSAGVVPEPNEYFFDVWPTEKQEVIPIVDYMQEKGIKRIALIYSLNDFSQSVRNNFVEQAKSRNIKIIEEFQVSPDEKDFKTIILKIKELNVDAIYGTFAFYPSQGTFSKQAKELNLNLTIYSSSGTEIPDLVQAYPQVEGTIYGFRADGPKEKEFAKNYVKKFGSVPSQSSAYAYDSANMLIQALKSDKQTPEEISVYLKDITYQGVSNTISFDNNGRITSKPFILKTIKDGKFVQYNN